MFISRVAACRSDSQAAAPIDQVGAITSLTMDVISTMPYSMDDPIGSVSPFSLDALYCSMATFQWIYRDGGDELEAKLAAIDGGLGAKTE